MAPTDYVPNMRDVEESFFHRNLQIPKNIQARQGGISTSRAGQSVKLQGEIPVTFYNYLLSSGMFNHEVLPLQCLYENHGQAMAPKEFPPIKSPPPPATDEQDGALLPAKQPLRIMEFPTCHYVKDFLEAFSESSKHIWNLQNRGGDLRPGVSFQPLDPKRFTIAISIPYLGVEENIRPPAPTQEYGASNGQDRLGLEVLERLKELTDFRRDRPLSWPRESLTLAQNRCPNVDYSNLLGNSAGKDFILVHRAGIILLNTSTSDEDDDNRKETLAIFRSFDDKNSGRVPLLPHQKSENALDAFLNVLSNTLKSSERAVLDNLRTKASNYWSNFQEFVRKPDASKDFGDRMISNSATLSGELSAVIDVARSQKRYIGDLREFLARLGPGPNHPNGSLQLSSKSSEQGNMILTKINFILEERQMFLDEVNEIFLEVKAIEKSFYQLSALRASQRLCEETQRASQRLCEETQSASQHLCKETVYEMKRQGWASRKAWWRRIIPSREKEPIRGP